jgi:TRAP-type C4-dicarboxylate transport system substrate-binding protein
MIEKIKASGTKVSYMTPAQTEAFIKAMKPVHEQFRGAIGSNLLDLTYRLIEENK